MDRRIGGVNIMKDIVKVDFEFDFVKLKWFRNHNLYVIVKIYTDNHISYFGKFYENYCEGTAKNIKQDKTWSSLVERLKTWD